MKPWNTVFELCDIVRETGFAIHSYLKNGHLEKVYRNAMVHRLRKQEIAVVPEPSTVALTAAGLAGLLAVARRRRTTTPVG
jgi:hypothetical protein